MDDIDLWIKILVFFGLLLLSAFFSGSETAVFSLTIHDQDELRQRKDKASKRLLRLLESPQKTLITILTGNIAVNVAAASIAVLLVSDFCELYHIPQVWGIFAEIIIVTGLIMILSEISPKIFALRNPKYLALRAAPLMEFFRIILFPVSIVLSKFTEFISSVLGVGRQRIIYSPEELKALVEVSEETGQLEKEEREMISSIFEFGDTLVKEVMVPRTDMNMINVDSSLEEIVNKIKELGHSRYPVHEGNRDNVIGFLYAKDLLPYLEHGEDFDLRKVIRPPNFVPKNKEIDQLLKEFQKDKIHMAVVVDEYGGTDGLITLEDILEEIVGEIQDEYDQESPLYTRLNDSVIVAEAKMEIADVNELLEDDLIPTKDDYETLGGFIYDLFGSVPEAGESIDYSGYKFTIEEVEGQRLIKIRIEKVAEGTQGN